MALLRNNHRFSGGLCSEIANSISNSIGQVLFQRADIREIYNQPTTPVSVPEAGSVEQPTSW